MSNATLPVLPGLEWGFKRLPMHKTTIKESVSGREWRSRRMANPRYTYKASYEFLRDKRQGYDELTQLLGFFNSRHGSFDDWLFTDPDDNSVTNQPTGIGDGVTTAFQLVRSLGGFAEPVYAPVTASVTAYVNGVGASAGFLDAGVMVMGAPPAAGAIVTWSGSFQWRCRFVQDQLEFAKFAWRLWNLKTFDFITLKPPF